MTSSYLRIDPRTQRVFASDDGEEKKVSPEFGALILQMRMLDQIAEIAETLSELDKRVAQIEFVVNGRR